jgi:hypothetical protein
MGGMRAGRLIDAKYSKVGVVAGVELQGARVSARYTR